MKHFIDRLLQKYDGPDWLLQRKARTLLVLNLVLFMILLIEVIVSSLLLGHPAPECIPNLAIAAGLALILVPLVRGRYHVAAGWGITVALIGISWTRYASTGHFSSDASYDFLQYVLDLIVVIFYSILIAHRRLIFIATFISTMVLLGVYTYALPRLFHDPVSSTTESVFISGFIFLILAGLISFFTYLQNKKAIEIAFQESRASEESERNYTEIFNSTNEAIFIHDAVTGQVLDVNTAMLKMYGFETKDQAMNLTIGDISADVSPYASKESAQYLRNAQTLGPQTFEWLAKKASGERFWVEVSLRKSEIGGKGRILAVVRNITDRKKAENELHASEELYRKLIIAISDIIIRTDLEGNIIFVNETGFPSFGYSKREQIIGKNVFSFISEKDKMRAQENTRKMFDEYLGAQEYTLIGENGTSFDCEVNGDVLRQNEGTPVGIVYIVRDLTEKKKLQGQLLQSQKMDAIGRLAGGIAHDYNNMIGVILGYAALLEKEIPSTEPAHHKVKSIIAAAERSANLTRQLLAFSRQQIIVPVLMNINEELSSLEKIFGHLIGEDIKLVVHRSDALWDIKIDPTQLTQIITNLATNARDAIINTGNITISTMNARIDQTMENTQSDIAPGEYVLLSFSDSGCGMTAATLTKIFEPFFTTKPKNKGTGLGLSTVFGIVKQNNGFINVASSIGQGTTFKIYFPRCIEKSTSWSEEYQETDLSGTETILVVEDEEELLNLTKNTLVAQGYKVFSAATPEEALSIHKRHNATIDLLITDVVMPGMNGKELNEHLEAVYPSLQTLYISGYTSDIVAKRGVLEEGTNFLQKPFSTYGLLKKVHQIIHRA
jgi:two-component system, cell cycle sensor histidine kinase and response regulator CckA